ncbi:DNA repair protein RecO [bacterium]|nr:MAG: DNA repair protein RecO [bacterium]
MSIQRTEAIILKTIPYGETSKILTTFTKNMGKVNLLAKGARDVKSKYGGSLELFTYISVIYYDRTERDLQYVSDVSVIDPFLQIHNDLDRTYEALAIIEMCNRLIHANEDNLHLFDLLVQTLQGIDRAEKRPVNGLLYFMLHVATRLGFTMDFDSCKNCRDVMDHKELNFSVEHGRVVCESCPSHLRNVSGALLSKESLGIMRQIARSHGNGIYNIAMSEKACNEVYHLLLRHLQYHMEELQNLNSLSFLKLA